MRRCFNTALYCPLSKRFSLESDMQFSVLSLGIKMVDVEESDESAAKLLTLFSGTNGSARLGVRYFLLKIYR